jgi:type IV secretion system protein TrbL
MPSIANPLNWLTGALGGAAKSLAGDAFESIARDFADAAGKASTWLWQQIGSSTAVSLGGAGFDRLLAIVMGIAVVVGMGLFVVQIITSLLRRDSAGLARAGKGLLVAFLGGAGAIALTELLLHAVDALSNGVVQIATGGGISRLGQGIMVAGAISSLVNPAAMLVLALIVIGAIVFIWAALMIRKLLIVIAAVFAPAAFAGSLADISTGWVKKWIEGMAALIASKLILVIMLLVGYYMLSENLGAVGAGGVAGGSPTGTQALTQVAAGGVVLLLAAFAPWVALKTVHFAGDHMAQLHAHATSATAGATTVLAAPQKLSTMMPSSRGGGGGAGSSGAPTPTGPPRGGPGGPAGQTGPAGPGAPSNGGGAAAAAGATAATGGVAAGFTAAGSAAKSAATSGVEHASAHMNGHGSTPGAGPSTGRPSGAPPSRPMPPSSPRPGPRPTPPTSS